MLRSISLKIRSWQKNHATVFCKSVYNVNYGFNFSLSLWNNCSYKYQTWHFNSLQIMVSLTAGKTIWPEIIVMRTFPQVVKLAAGQNDLHSRSIFPLKKPWYISRDSTALAFTAESPTEMSRQVTVSDAEAKLPTVLPASTRCKKQSVNDFQDFREHLPEVVVSVQVLPTFDTRQLSQSWRFP